MTVLLLAEVTDGELALDATSKAVAAAKMLGDVTVLCAGGSAAAAGEAAAGETGGVPRPVRPLATASRNPRRR